MKVIKSKVFTTNVQNIEISGLGTDSTKRLHQFVDRLFNPKLDNEGFKAGGPIFDDKARDVLLKYELHQGEIQEEVKYLDSIRYGGRYSPNSIIQQIQRFQAEHAPSFRWNRNYKDAIKDVREMIIPKHFLLEVIRYRSDDDVRQTLPREDTHSGFEFIVTGFKEKGAYMEGSFDQFEVETETARRNGTFGKPILPAHRLQCSGAYDAALKYRRTGECKWKTRLVSMVDLWVILAECMWAKPFQHLMHNVHWYAGGKKPIDLSQIVNTKRMHYKYWFSIDYSQFDQSIPSWLIRDAFSIIHDSFKEFKDLEWLWEILVNDFINKAFVGPDGHLHYAENGVPSGSMFTQIIDTLCNRIMIATYFHSISKKRNQSVDYDCMICGDDNLGFANEVIDLNDLSGYLKRCFGILCKPEKCSQGKQVDSPQFLSREWRHEGEWRHPKELVAKMLYPERWRPYQSEPSLVPEAIVYSYILTYPRGMDELIDVRRFMRDHVGYLKSWTNAIFGYQTGYLSYLQRYEMSSS